MNNAQIVTNKKAAYLAPVLFCFMLLVTLASCSVNNQDSYYQEGDVKFTYEGGSIQCLTQRGPFGTVVVLVKSLNENTLLYDIELGRVGNIYAVNVTVGVKKEAGNYGSWVDIHNVVIQVEPVDVPAITLEGKPIQKHGRVIVLIPVDAKIGYLQDLDFLDKLDQ